MQIHEAYPFNFIKGIRPTSYRSKWYHRELYEFDAASKVDIRFYTLEYRCVEPLNIFGRTSVISF